MRVLDKYGARRVVSTVQLGAVSIPFADGDTLRRVSVVDAGVTAGSLVAGTVRRPDTADDGADPGYLYVANVVRVYAGGFDLLIGCMTADFDDATEVPPNETVQFIYAVG